MKSRLENVDYLNTHLAKFEALTIQPHPGEGSTHSYYVHPIKFNKEFAGIHRNTFVDALKAELPSAILRETAPLIGSGYVKPLYLQPIYQQKAAWAFNPVLCKQNVNYKEGLCPVAEKMHFEELFTNELMRPGMTKDDINDVSLAIEKIFENVNELKNASIND